VEDPPAESGSAKALTRGPCAQCVAAGKLCVQQGGHRATACEQGAKMKGGCSFTKKDAALEPAADSDIETIDRPAKRPNTVKPTQGPVTIDIPEKSRPSGSRSRGTDLSEVVASIRGLAEVGIRIQRELRGQRLAAEEQFNELRKHRRVMTESSKILHDIGTLLLDWLEPEELGSGSRGEEDKEEEGDEGPDSVMESDTESEAEKVVEKEVEAEQEQEQEQEQEPEKEPAAEVKETMDTSQ